MSGAGLSGQQSRGGRGGIATYSVERKNAELWHSLKRLAQRTRCFLARGGPFGAIGVGVHVLLGCSLLGTAEASALPLLPERLRVNFCAATPSMLLEL